MVRLASISPVGVVSAALFMSGCFLAQPFASTDGGADAGGIVIRLDAGPVDAAPVDTGPVDAGPGDAGSVDTDAGPVLTDDAGPRDAGCAEAPQCNGEFLEMCGAQRDCRLENAYCDSNASPPTCTMRECTPNTTECRGDRLVRCDGRGQIEDDMLCPGGCENRTCLLADSCPGGLAGALAGPGHSQVFDLCNQGDDLEFEDQADCGGSDPSTSNDIVVSWTVAQRGMYDLSVFDADGNVTVDPVLYIRTVCNMPTTQIACSDDRGGSPSGLAPFIRRFFEPGVYFLVIDSFDVSASCGDVRLDIFPS